MYLAEVDEIKISTFMIMLNAMHRFVNEFVEGGFAVASSRISSSIQMYARWYDIKALYSQTIGFVLLGNVY